MTVTDQDVDRVARALWESDVETDPMLHVSWEAARWDYRRRALVAIVELAGVTP